MRVAHVMHFLAVTAWSTLAGAAPCLQAISEPTTRKVFDTLAQAKPSDGCVLEGVTTENAQMSIRWKKGDRVLDALTVLPSRCAANPTPGSRLTAIVPPPVESACPAAIAATRAAVDDKSLGELVPVVEPVAVPDKYAALSPLVRYRLVIAGGGAALLLAAVGSALWLWRRRKRQSSTAA